MAVKGSISKEEVFNKLLEVFPNSFMYNDNKECRINMIEDGEPVQIKVTLTAAKAPVECGEDKALPGEEPTKSPAAEVSAAAPASIELTEEEKQNVSDLMAALNL